MTGLYLRTSYDHSLSELWLDAALLPARYKRRDLFSYRYEPGSRPRRYRFRDTRLSFPKPLDEFFLALMRSERDVNETAFHQIQRFGYKPEAVKHIIQTHLHLDHAGGLADFPNAQVHVLKAEYEHVQQHGGWEYHPEHWEHHPKWVLHEANGRKWYDFDAIQLEGFEPEIWLVPLTGHTPGHAAVTIKQDQHWVMHGGDAVPFDMKVDEVNEWITKKMLGPHLPRIRQFMKAHPEVQIVGSHMSLDFYEKS